MPSPVLWPRMDPRASGPAQGHRVAPEDGGPGSWSGASAPASSYSRLPLLDDSSRAEHPLTKHPDLLDSVKLIQAKPYAHLPRPLARSQDLPEGLFQAATGSDIVISVSDAWRNQMHPDPKGSKHHLICELLSRERLLVDGVLLFTDWTGVPQRPCEPGRAQRTPEEAERFAAALTQMHKMHFYADRLIHVEGEQEAILGEGAEYEMNAPEMKGAVFGQVGDWVQIVGDSRKQSTGSTIWGTQRSMSGILGRQHSRPSSFEGTSQEAWAMFDRVLAVDGEQVTSVARLHQLLSLEASGSKVRLCRYPAGRRHDVPTDSMGWYPMARIIAMVKCAMLDEVTASGVVVTNSPAIRDEILGGAAALREAAQEAGGEVSGAAGASLRRALEGLLSKVEAEAAARDTVVLDELAASDAADAAATTRPANRKAVAEAMRQFMDHLCQHWDAEADEQRRRQRVLDALIESAQAHFVDPHRFSEDYMEKLAAVSVWNPFHALILLIVPPALSLAWLLPHYRRPDEGRELQGLWIWWGQTWLTMLCHYSFPNFISQVSGVQSDWSVKVKVAAWTVVSAVVSAAFRAWLVEKTGVFPLPMGACLGSTILSVLMPYLWFCIPRHQRSEGNFRKRCFCAFVVLWSMLLVFGIIFPMMNVGVFKLSVRMQALAVLGYLLAKAAWEKVGPVMARYVGADAMPCFVFGSTFLFEFNMCVAFAGGFDPVVFVELIAIDALENMYELWRFAQHAKHVQAKGGPSPEELAAEYCEISELILREFVEMVVPAHFLFLFLVVRKVRPEFSDLICTLSAADFNFTAAMIGVNIVVEVVVAAGTLTFLSFYGYKPVHMLQGLLSTQMPAFLPLATCSTAYFMSLQFAHQGNDPNMKFPWLQGTGAHWSCGLQWAVP